MSWVVDKHKLLNNYFLDVDEISEVFSVYSDESVNLNEHNWLYNVMEDVVVAGKAEPDFCMVVAHTRRARSHRDITGEGKRIVQSTAWVPIENGVVNWDSGGGKAVVIITGQLHLNVGSLDQSGLNLAIEVDGTVHTEGLIGTGDQANDYVDSGLNVLATSGGGSGFTLGYGSSPSLRALDYPFLVKVMLNLSPGRHTARLVTRNLFMNSTVYQYVTNYEAIVLDLWS
jgi:hypothetical protein